LISLRRTGLKSLALLEEFLKALLDALDVNDRDLRAKAASLVSDNSDGLLIIVDIVKSVGNPEHNPALRNLRFDRHIVPFMRLLVHQAFADLSLEGNFRYIIKTFYGDGERAASFFEGAIQKLLLERINLPSTPPDAIHETNIYLLCRLLNSVVRHTSEAMADERLISLYTRLYSDSIEPKIIADEQLSVVEKLIKKSLEDTAAYLLPLSTRMAKVKTSDSSEKLTSEASNVYCVHLERIMDKPGELSGSGRRHDNDSHEIDHISILPTKDELHCSRPPYLPINDAVAPHFLEGPARLFDIHFRLLREDMLGPLQTAVSFVLAKIKPGEPLSKVLAELGRPQRGMTSIRLFHRVSVVSASFQRFKGLVFRFRFQQPPKFRSLQRKDRCEKWETSRSLENGSLLCLVSNIPEVECFLTVIDKSKDDLGKDAEWAFINLVVAELKEEAHRCLLNLLSATKLGQDSLTLIEFPGILLSAYNSILENLQIRWKHPVLPFSELLSHDNTSTKSSGHPSGQSVANIVSVDPPFYATRHARFLYDLAPLKPHPSPSEIQLSPRASPQNDTLLRKLEQETTLDRGQCKGLIAALTQELALIQGFNSSSSRPQTDFKGPPGTGKTYLGVELVKVLLHNKRRLELGPIICV